MPHRITDSNGNRLDRLTAPRSPAQARRRLGLLGLGLLTAGTLVIGPVSDRDSNSQLVTAAGAVLPNPEIFGAEEAAKIVAAIEHGEVPRVLGKVKVNGPVNLRTTPRIVRGERYDSLSSGFNNNIDGELDAGDAVDHPNYATTAEHGDWLVGWQEDEDGHRRYYFISTEREVRANLEAIGADGRGLGGLPHTLAPELSGDFGRIIQG